MSDINLVYWY